MDNLSFFQKQNLCLFENWKLEKKVSLGKNFNLYLLNKKDREVCIDISFFWIDLFGRYFLVKQLRKKYLFVCLSLSPVYLQAKLEWLKKQQDPVCQQLFSQESIDIKDLALMDAKLKANLNPNETKYFSSEKRKYSTLYLPLVNSDSSFLRRGFQDENKIYVKGPLGLGIQINAETINHHLIIVKNEAIIPFLDFLELMYQRAIIQHTQSKDHPFFKEEYSYYYCNDGKFWLYWEITSEF